VSGHVYESVATITVLKVEALAATLFAPPRDYRTVVTELPDEP
jgi:hypothetical protein